MLTESEKTEIKSKVSTYLGEPVTVSIDEFYTLVVENDSGIRVECFIEEFKKAKAALGPQKIAKKLAAGIAIQKGCLL
jgi:hypothetical protein